MIKQSDSNITEPETPGRCPACGEPVKARWKICPACETRLQALTCPACGQPVKENWKCCPECEALLLCPACHMRIPAGEFRCPRCACPDPKSDAWPEMLAEPVCGMELVLIPGGTFQMGDTIGVGAENEYPLHPVQLEQFYMARYPVTQEQWSRIMPENPSRHQGADLPVEQVSWHDAQSFVRQLTQAQQETYRFRLPTEAEWEYAARSGGRDELYAGGEDIERLAWYEENSQGRTHPVGTKAANGFGLYDLSGNVWEWCQDLFLADAYQQHDAESPVIHGEGTDRVIRGGSWNLDAWSARCTRRFSFTADFFGPGLGFRVVMVPAPPQE